MSVIAGVIDFSSANSTVNCSQILLRQGVLGEKPHQIRRLEGAQFGISGGNSDGLSSLGDVLLIADSRIDNIGDIAARTGRSNRRSGLLQAETLLAAWVKDRSGVLDQVVGDYALAVYDRKSRTVTLARDPTGQRPLFFKIHGAAIAFASLPSGLKDVFSPSESNLSLLARNLEGGRGGGGENYLTGMGKVEPGEIVTISAGTITRRFHWQPRVDGIPRPTGEDYVGSYRTLLDAAVHDRIRSQVRPIGSQLSSGLDSSAVTATAATLIDPKSDLVAFTAAPREQFADRLIRHRFADESALAAETARMHGIRHVIIRETAPVFDIVRDESRHLQAPILDPFNMAWWAQIRREAKQIGARALLTGELGNLTLNAGNLYMLTAFIQSGSWTRWLREAARLGTRPNVRWRGVLINSFGHLLPETTRNRLRKLFLRIPIPDQQSFVRREWRDIIRQEVRGAPSPNPYRWLLDGVRQMDFGLQRKAALAGYGIEELDPLSDRRILEFALRVPPEEMLSGGRTRALARAALKDRVPESVLNLQTRGLQSADWHLRISQQAVRDVLEAISSNSNVQNLLDVGKIDRAIQDWPTTDMNSYANIVTYRNQLIGALSVGIYLTENDRGA